MFQIGEGVSIVVVIRLPTGRGDVMVTAYRHGLVRSMADPVWSAGVTGAYYKSSMAGIVGQIVQLLCHVQFQRVPFYAACYIHAFPSWTDLLLYNTFAPLSCLHPLLIPLQSFTLFSTSAKHLTTCWYLWLT